jgi:hypothetical protein
MKKLLILLSFFALTTSAFSQSEKPLQIVNLGADLDAPLTEKERGYIDEVYGDYANELVYNNPHRLKSFKNILRNRVVINRYDGKNLASMTNLSQVPLVNSINNSLSRDGFFNENNFNPLKYNFGFFSRIESHQYYRVDNIQYVITILPQH